MSTPEKIDDAASRWAVQLERGLTGTEQDAFLQWLAADIRHAKALEEQRANWKRLNLLADWRPEHGVKPNRDLLAPSHRPRSPWLKHARWFAPLAAAAAAAVAIVWTLYTPPPPGAVPRPQSAPAAQITAIEERTLEDGSVIKLNRNAEVVVVYTPTERRVRLERGEATFQVAKNPQRPFIVSVGDVSLRAVGTAFNVRRDTGSLELIVTEGRVQVQPAVKEATEPVSNNPILVSLPLVDAGQRAVVPLTPQLADLVVTKIAAEQIEEKLAWHPRLLDFTNTPLSAVVEEFNRRNAPIRIVIADAALADTSVSATLRSDNIESFVRLLEGGFGAEVKREGSVITLHRRSH